MTNLKTLKDILHICYECKRINNFTDSCTLCIQEDKLKQEAIKWVKELQEEKQRCVPIGEKEDNMGFWYIQDNQIDWIKHFFNLTEEELK